MYHPGECKKTMGSVSSRNTTETQVIGTLISVQGFLEKIPVRGKCLTSSKSPYTKTLVQVRTALTAVYLCNRLLTVKLIDDNNEVRSLFPGVSEHLSQQEGIEQAWRTLFSQDSRMTLAGNELINESTNNINISGYWSNTAESLTKSRQYLSVNGKPSKCGLVSHVINTLYKRACKGNDVKRYSLRGRRYPSFFVEISCNPEHVDVIPAGGLFNTSFKYSQGIAILLMRIVTHVLEINRHTVPTCLGLYQGMWLSINKEGNQNIESDDMSLSEPEIPISRDGSSQLEPEVDIHTSTQLLPKFVDEEERGHESISSSAVFRSIPILRKQLRPVKIVPPKPLSLEMIPLTCEKIDSPASDTTVVVEYETASSGSTDDDIIQLDDVIDDSDNDFLPADISRSSLPEEGSHQLVDEIVSRSSAPSILAGCSFDDDIFGIESLSSPIPRGWNRTPFSDSCTSRESLPCGRDKVVELPKASSDSQVVLQKTCAPESKSSSKLVKRQKVEAAEALDSNSDSIVVNDFRTERCILKGSSVPLVDPPTTVRQTGVIIGNPFKSRLLEKRKASLVQSNPERNASLLKSVPSVDQETCPLSTAVLLKRRKYEQTQPDEECLDDGNKIPKTEIQPTEVTDTSAETAIDNELEKSQKELSQAQIATYAPNIWRRWYDGKTTVASKTGQLLKHVTVRKEDLTSNNFHVVGQACNQFVICFNGSTNQLYAVDQHAADERVKLEILLSSVGELIKSKKQLSAITIQATDSELIAVIQSTEELQRYGWEFTIEESSVTFFQCSGNSLSRMGCSATGCVD